MVNIPYLCPMFIRETKKSNSTPGSNPERFFLQYVLVYIIKTLDARLPRLWKKKYMAKNR